MWHSAHPPSHTLPLGHPSWTPARPRLRLVHSPVRPYEYILYFSSSFRIFKNSQYNLAVAWNGHKTQDRSRRGRKLPRLPASVSRRSTPAKLLLKPYAEKEAHRTPCRRTRDTAVQCRGAIPLPTTISSFCRTKPPFSRTLTFQNKS